MTRRSPLRRLVALDPAGTSALRATAAVAVVGAATRLAQVVLLAHLVAGLVDHLRTDAGAPAFANLSELAALGICCVVVGAAADALSRVLGTWAAGRAKHRLQARVLAGAARRGYPADERLAPVLSTGLDRLDELVAEEWPARVRAAVVPAAAVVLLVGLDWRSALVGVAMLPLVPLLAAVVGARTAAKVRKEWRASTRLAGAFLDAVEGLVTLRLYGRADAHGERLRRAGEAHRRLTLGVLRTAFLSGATTQLVATLAVGLTAVVCGTRLVAGDLDLATALTVILLVPELFRAPLDVAARFHRSAEVHAVLADVADLARDDASPVASAERGTAAEVSDLSVVYRGRSAPAVSGLTAAFRPRTLTAIAGASGSGKSTVLRVLVGTLPATSGVVRRGPAVGYLPQHPRFPAPTVAAALRAGQPDATDDDLRAALRVACAEDLVDPSVGGLDRPLAALLPSLSTGERRRLGIARAVLAADRPGGLLVLDEPTAHLDAGTENEVLRRLAQFARTRDVSIVMAAHRPAALDAADTVLRLSPGPAAERGPVRRGGLPPQRQPADVPPGERTAVDDADDARDVDVDAATPASTRPAALAVVAGVLSSVSGLALTATAAGMLVLASTHPPLLALSSYAVAVRGFALARPVLRYGERLLSHDAAFRRLTALRLRTWELLVPRVPGRDLPARGDLLTRVVRDVDDQVDGTVRGLHARRVLVGTGAVAVVGLALVVAQLAILVAASLLLAAGIAWVVDARVHATATRDLQVARSIRNGTVVDVTAALDDVVGNGGVTAPSRLLDAGAARVTSASRRLAVVESGTNAVVGVVGGALPFIAALVVAGLGLGTTGQVAAAAVLVTAVLADEVVAWPAVVRAVRVGREAAARLGALGAAAPASVDPAHRSVLPAEAVGIELADVAAGWAADRPAVTGLDLAAAPGRRVALTGPSGCGKSTVAAVALHLLDPAAGAVHLAGIDYRRLAGDAVRRRVGSVGVGDHVFAGTVRENLTLGRPAHSDEELVRALSRAHLDGWLAALPHGLDTELGAGATTVSGGEARRLSVARALLGAPDVLILDEPVEGLDAETADAVMRDLAADDPHVGWLLLAHRPEGTEHVDVTCDLSSYTRSGRFVGGHDRSALRELDVRL